MTGRLAVRRIVEMKVLVTSIACLPPMALLHGYLLHTMWAWFAVPIGAPVIGLWHAYGLAVMGRLGMSIACKTDSGELTVPEVLDNALFWLVYSLLLFAMAAAAHALM